MGRSNLALLLEDHGDLGGARELLEKALLSDLRNLGEDHPSVALRSSNLALVLQGQGDLGGSRKLLEPALASSLKNLGEDHPSVAHFRMNLALTLRDLGEHQNAAREAREALRVGQLQSEGIVSGHNSPDDSASAVLSTCSAYCHSLG